VAGWVRPDWRRWMQEGMAETAEDVFTAMKQTSDAVAARGTQLADRWLGGDLEAVKMMLHEQPLAMSMCHTSQSYVKLIDACVPTPKR
jgi:hypothetical protein